MSSKFFSEEQADRLTAAGLIGVALVSSMAFLGITLGNNQMPLTPTVMILALVALMYGWAYYKILKGLYK